MTRLFFVCPKGHIFRSLKQLKKGRLWRVCNECAAFVDTKGHDSMPAARAAAEKLPFSKSYIQVFVKGQIQVRKKAA